jgi:hypothetical protein
MDVDQTARSGNSPENQPITKIAAQSALLINGSMKRYSTLAFVALLVFTAGCEAPKPGMKVHRDYVTDLDFTTTTDFDAATLSGKKPLRQFGTNNVEGFSDNYIFGEYRGPIDDTGGHNFYIFPDGSFVIEAFCDICQPETVAFGKWRLEGNELVVFDLTERINVSSVLSGMKWVKEHFGAVDKLRLFVTERDESIGDTVLVSDETVRKGPHVEWRYIRRIEYYRDWPKEQKRLLGK